MPKGPRQTMGRDLEKPKRLTVREAVFFVLGGLAVAGGAYALSSDKSDENVPKPVVTNSAPVAGEGESDVGEEWPPNLVSEICFDKNPLDYVDVDQCRELIFQATGRKVPKDDQEFDQHCEDRRAEKREEKGNDIVSSLCLNGSSDESSIKHLARDGYTTISEVNRLNGGTYQIILLHEETARGMIIRLTEEPGCIPETLRDRQVQEDETKKEKTEMAVQGKWDDFFGDIDIEDVEAEMRKEAISEEMADLLRRYNKTKTQLKGGMTKLDMIRLACGEFGNLYRMTDMGGFSPETLKVIKENSTLDSFIKKYEELMELLGESVGLDHYEECILYSDYMDSK